jgi:predicted transcriptional regulator
MSSKYLVRKVGSRAYSKGMKERKTLEEMIRELGTSKVSALKWLQSLERYGSLIYRRTRLTKPGRRGGRPQNVYHPTRNLKTLEKESSNAMVVVIIDFSKLKTMCRYEKGGGMCKALIPKLQRCDSQLCPYLK